MHLVHHCHCINITIVSDGWSNLRNESIINITLATLESIFYKAVEAGEKRHTAVCMSELFNSIIQEVGENKVAAIITDGAAKMLAAHNILKMKYPKIQTLRCASHQGGSLSLERLSLQCLVLRRPQNVFYYISVSSRLVTLHLGLVSVLRLGRLKTQRLLRRSSFNHCKYF